MREHHFTILRKYLNIFLDFVLSNLRSLDLVTENSNKKYLDYSIYFFAYMSNDTSYFSNQIKPTTYLKDYNRANPYKN